MKKFEDPTPIKSEGKHPCVEWGGKRWYKTQEYFVDRSGKLLHRAIYESINGPIEDDLHIHHIDEDKTNNNPENLIALSVSEHVKSHKPRGFVRPDFDKAVGAKAMWAKRKPKKCTCAECDSEFESTCTRARFCCHKCSYTYYYYKSRGKRP